MPAVISNAALVHDQTALALLGFGLFGLAVMAAVLSNQLGNVDTFIGIHLNAAGITDRWGPRSTLWQIPVLVGFTTMINLVLAWFLAPHDRFASRFVLAAALVVQLVSWIALLDYL